MNPVQVQPERRTVRQLLADDHYEVPVYQRNYAWGEEEIRQLIDDLLDSVRDNAIDQYFLGNLVVSTADGSAERPLSVIDGQQRLTTLHLLFEYIRKSPPSGTTLPVVNPLRFESRPRSEGAFRELGSVKTLTDVDAGVLNGFRIINQYERSPELRSPPVVQFILDNVLVVRIGLPPGTDLNRYFEVMNTRGEQLQQQDIVKARMMARLTDDNARSTFAWVWDACARMDVYVQMALTPGSPGLRDKVFGTDWAWPQADSFAGLVSYRLSGAGGGPDAVLRRAESIDDAIAAYAKATSAAEEDEDPERFSSVIQFPVFLLHVLRVVHETGDHDEDEDSLDDKRLVKQFSRYLDSDSAEERVQGFALALLRCRVLFDAFVLKREFTMRTGDDGIWSLKRLVRVFTAKGPAPRYVGTYPLTGAATTEEEGDNDSDASKRVRLLQSALRVTFTSPRTMHWVTLLLRLASKGQPTEMTYDRMIGQLEAYVRGKIGAVFDADGELAVRGFDVPRIVFTYTDYLLAVRDGKLDFQFTFRNSIEHFYPQHPDAELQAAYAQLVDVEDRDRFGNLALVTVRDNSKFTNSLPKLKAEYSHIILQSPKLGEMAKRAATWGSEEILAHHRDVVAILWRDVTRG